MGFFEKISKAIKFVPKQIDKKIEEEIADKTQVAVFSALQTLDKTTPILTTLLAGGTIKAEISIKLIDTDGSSV